MKRGDQTFFFCLESSNLIGYPPLSQSISKARERKHRNNTLPILMHIMPIPHRFGSQVFSHFNFPHHEKITKHNVIDSKLYMLMEGSLEQTNKLTHYFLHPNIFFPKKYYFALVSK